MGPWMTNALHNRNQAVRLFEAGATGKQIARWFPRVWEWTGNGDGQGLQQKYDDNATRSLHRSDPHARELGILETNIMIASHAIDGYVRKLKQKGERQ